MKEITIKPIELKWHEGMPLVDYRYFVDKMRKGHRVQGQILDLGGDKGKPCYKVRILDDKKEVVNNWRKITFDSLEKAKEYTETVISFHCNLYLN